MEIHKQKISPNGKSVQVDEISLDFGEVSMNQNEISLCKLVLKKLINWKAQTIGQFL